MRYPFVLITMLILCSSCATQKPVYPFSNTDLSYTELEARYKDVALFKSQNLKQFLVSVEEIENTEKLKSIGITGVVEAQLFVDEGVGGRAANWLIKAYANHTKGWLLGYIVLTHNFHHIGQAFSVRSMHGLSNPW